MSTMQKDIFHRTELLLGEDIMLALGGKRVIIFGVGGVESWCAESLIRSGIGHLTIVDPDKVCESNINRQLMATTTTIGQLKVELLKERLQTISPEAEITAIPVAFNADTADSFNLGSYDFVIDAIDSLKDKILLIHLATQTDAELFSSMGAALKTDPSRIRVTEFWNVKMDPLARAIRKRMRQTACLPGKEFQCVFSDELLENKMPQAPGERANGTLVHITAIFGLTLASLVINRVRTSV